MFLKKCIDYLQYPKKFEFVDLDNGVSAIELL